MSFFCFNGAALFQVRKDWWGSSISRRAPVLQWGRTLSSAERSAIRPVPVRLHYRFNGAALFQVRKEERGEGGKTARPMASMGPHSFKCGKCISTASSARRLTRASMGPHSFKCGKPNRKVRRKRQNLPLQWGRTLSSAESSKQNSRIIRNSLASMGPHSFKCGKKTISVLHCRTMNGASMGPHSFKCGKCRLRPEWKADRKASMGPHSFKCGKEVPPPAL